MRDARVLFTSLVVSLIPALAAGQTLDLSRVRDAVTRGTFETTTD